MRSGLSAVAAKGNITAQWVFEVDGNYWTFGNPITYDSNVYTSRVISDSFTGISEKNTRYADKMIPPNTTEFSITGDKAEFSAPGFKGDDVLITLLDSGVKVFSWRFSVKSCDYSMGKYNFKCEDFLQKYLFNRFFPTTSLLNPYNTTSAVMAGPENAVIPIVFGVAFPQLRQIPSAGEWYTVLGAVAGTYTVTKIQSPVEFDSNFSEYATPTYTFTNSTLSGLRVFGNNIGYEGGNLPFGTPGSPGKLYDMPTQFSNSLTVGVTSAADIIATVLQDLGVPLAQIDTAGTFAATKATLATLGITYNYCFTTKEDAEKVLCELLESCNCILPRSDVVQLIALEDGAAVKTIDRDNILNLTFSEKIYPEIFDGGYAQYFTGVQAGQPSEIEIPIDGVSSSNVSGDKILYKYTSDTQRIQELAIINFRRKYLKTGTVGFMSNHSMLEPYLGDRLNISDVLYEDYENVYVDQITIKPDLKFEFSLDAYSETIGDLTDYTPSAVSKITDVSLAKTDNVMKSDGYDAGVPGDSNSWYKIDPENGEALFNNITMTFTGSQGAGNMFTNACDDVPVGAENDLWIPKTTCETIIGTTKTILDSDEHEPTQGEFNSALKIDENNAFLAYEGGGTNNGFVKVFGKATDGTITTKAVLEHEITGKCQFISATKISQTIYGLAYSEAGTGTAGNGVLKIFEVLETSPTTFTITEKSKWTHTFTNTAYNSFKMVTSTTFTLAYQGPLSVGYLKTLTYNPATYTFTFQNRITTDSVACSFTSLIVLDDTNVMLAYSGNTNGKLKVYDISTITAIVLRAGGVTFDATSGDYCSLVELSTTLYAVAYAGDSADGILQTVTMNATTYALTLRGYLEHDTGQGIWNSMISLSNTQLSLAYVSSSVGYIKTFITTDVSPYIEELTPVLTYSTATVSSTSYVQLDETSYFIAHTKSGTGFDGWVRTIGFGIEEGYIADEMYISTAGEWILATKYQETSVTTIAAAMIDTPLVITSQIRDADSNLVLDFDTATVTVNSDAGLTVKSGAGISMLTGGDINFFNDGTEDSAIKFYNNESKTASDQTVLIHAAPNSYGVVGDVSLNIYPDSDSSNCFIGLAVTNRFQNAGSYAYNRLVYAVSDESGLSEGDPYTYVTALEMLNGEMILNSSNAGNTGFINIVTEETITMTGSRVNQTLDTSAPADAEVSNDHCIFYYISGNLWAKWKEGSTVYNKQVT